MKRDTIFEVEHNGLTELCNLREQWLPCHISQTRLQSRVTQCELLNSMIKSLSCMQALILSHYVLLLACDVMLL